MMSPSHSHLYLNNIQVLSRPAPVPGRVNEDAWLVLETAKPPGYVFAAVIDGAGERLGLPPLRAMLGEKHLGLTSAAFAATQVRTSLVSQFNSHPDRSLREVLLTANDTLQTAIAETVGSYSAESILTAAGMPLDSDPRRMRLALPAAVVTLVRLDVTRRQLEYAHAGDTALLEIRRNGEVICHTSDQMGRYDNAVLQYAVRLRREKDLPHLSDAVSLPEVRRLDIENGLRHNYVDEFGRTQPGEGCGVIDGLPELADYIERGSIPIDPEQTAGLCLLSDGLQLPAPLNETAAQAEARLQLTGDLLRTRGVRGLFEAVREMAQSDPHLDQYPRMKVQDDATGVYLENLTKE